jgi:Asp-tRNA(Asn)/Glu-tRNA(Gln) amidotransferase A subunit family amidase
MDLRRETVRGLADRVRRRELSARELVAHSLERIEALDPAVDAFVVVDGGRALVAAAELDERLAGAGDDRGHLARELPLAGIPLAVKDLEDVAGLRTTKGSALLADAPPALRSSIHTRRLQAAGAIVVGKTNTPEHGFTADTFSAVGGVTRNPWDLARSPGGSSGGSAAAIAAGMVPLATGSDGGGSIRIPSALCGLSGMKPSQGRIPSGPGAPSSGLFSCVGPMARRIADVAHALAAVVGPHPADPFALPPPSEPWTGAVDDVGVPARVVWAPDMGWDVDAEVRRLTSAAVDRLADAGADVVEVPEVFREDPTGPWFTLWTAYLLRSFDHVRGTPDWELVTPGVRAMVDHAVEHVGPADVTRALDAIHRANAEVAEVLTRGSVLLCPTVAGRAPVSERQGTIDGVESPLWVRFTYPFNLTRNPAGTVGVGTAEDGLPVGLQVVGPQHGDLAVLRAVAALEELIGWDEVAPDR